VKFGTEIHRTERILDNIHTDNWGPTKATSLGGMYYFVSFIDDFSRRYWVHNLRKKGEVLNLFAE